MPGSRPTMLSRPKRHPAPGMTKRSSIQYASRARRRNVRSHSSESWIGLDAAPSLLGNDPDRVDDAGYVAQQRKQNVQPAMAAEADLQEYAERGQATGHDDKDDVHDRGPLVKGFRPLLARSTHRPEERRVGQ